MELTLQLLISSTQAAPKMELLLVILEERLLAAQTTLTSIKPFQEFTLVKDPSVRLLTLLRPLQLMEVS